MGKAKSDLPKRGPMIQRLEARCKGCHLLLVLGALCFRVPFYPSYEFAHVGD